MRWWLLQHFNKRVNAPRTVLHGIHRWSILLRTKSSIVQVGLALRLNWPLGVGVSDITVGRYHISRVEVAKFCRFKKKKKVCKNKFAAVSISIALTTLVLLLQNCGYRFAVTKVTLLRQNCFSFLQLKNGSKLRQQRWHVGSELEICTSAGANFWCCKHSWQFCLCRAEFVAAKPNVCRFCRCKSTASATAHFAGTKVWSCNSEIVAA